MNGATVCVRERDNSVKATHLRFIMVSLGNHMFFMPAAAAAAVTSTVTVRLAVED